MVISTSTLAELYTKANADIRTAFATSTAGYGWFDGPPEIAEPEDYGCLRRDWETAGEYEDRVAGARLFHENQHEVKAVTTDTPYAYGLIGGSTATTIHGLSASSYPVWGTSPGSTGAITTTAPYGLSVTAGATTSYLIGSSGVSVPTSSSL